MGWAAIFAVVWEFVKPFLNELLRALLDRLAQRRGTFSEADAAGEITRFFDDAERELGRLQFFQLWRLRRGRRAALKRVPEIVAAARAVQAAAIPPLSAAELAEVLAGDDEFESPPPGAAA